MVFICVTWRPIVAKQRLVSRICGVPFKALDVPNSVQQHYDATTLTEQQLKTSHFPFSGDYEASVKSSFGSYVGDQELLTTEEQYAPNTDFPTTGAKSKLDLVLYQYSSYEANRKQKRQSPTHSHLKMTGEINLVNGDSYIAHMFGKRMASRRGIF